MRLLVSRRHFDRFELQFEFVFFFYSFYHTFFCEYSNSPCARMPIFVCILSLLMWACCERLYISIADVRLASHRPFEWSFSVLYLTMNILQQDCCNFISRLLRFCGFRKDLLRLCIAFVRHILWNINPQLSKLIRNLQLLNKLICHPKVIIFSA